MPHGSYAPAQCTCMQIRIKGVDLAHKKGRIKTSSHEMAAQQDPPLVLALATHPWSVVFAITVALIWLSRRDIENAAAWTIAHPYTGVFMLVLFTVISIVAAVALNGLYIILILTGVVLLAFFVWMLDWKTVMMFLLVVLFGIVLAVLLEHNAAGVASDETS